MNPWMIIGWVILVMLLAKPIFFLVKGICVLLSIHCGAVLNYIKRLRHFMTRNIAPKAGQKWRDNVRYREPNLIEVEEVDLDRCVYLCYGYRNSCSLEEWKEQVKANHRYLVKRA
jgi:hypothetical protein